MPAKKSPALAYSYMRFSNPEQSRGDSLTRQTELRDRWVARNGVRLDTSLTLRDEGVSAFTGKHRDNPDRHALATFLELVRAGRIPRGSYLIVESLDRLSREHIRPALTLLLNLIDSGVRVVQLLPIEAVYDEHVEPMTLVMAIMELSRGNSESRMKSERLGPVWRRKKERAAKGVIVTRALPAWVRVKGGRLVLDIPAAAIVRRIFRLAREGHGLGVITKRLNAERVPPIARGSKWARSYVAKILTNRAVVGEYQPHAGRVGPDRKPDGPPVPGYFPAVVSEADWHATRAALAARRGKGGRIGRRVNVFAGLLRDARDGGSLVLVDKGKESSGPSLVSSNATAGVPGAVYVSFPLATFEAAVLSQLREIDPRSVLPPKGDNGAAEVDALEGRRAAVAGRLEKVRARLVGSYEDVGTLADAAATLERDLAAVEADLRRARQQAAVPLVNAWADCQSLAAALASAGNATDARTRLRAALRRIVTEVRCLFVAKGSERIAAVQVWFAGGRHRSYLVRHTPARGNAAARRPSVWSAESFTGAFARYDLRKPEAAAALAAALVSN